MDTVFYIMSAIIAGGTLGFILSEMYNVYQYYQWKKFKESHKNMFN